MNITLELRYSDAPLREAEAWFIAGGDPAVWLAEMITWQVPLNEARLLLIPGGDGGTIAGVVVVPGRQPVRRHAALPYGRLAGRLLLPVEAAVNPPMTEAEIEDLLPSGKSLLVWHPSAGLLQFGEENQLTVAQLLHRGPRTSRQWDAAVPGVATNQRLLSIEPLVRPSLGDIVRLGQDDIGSEPLAGGKLPRATSEPAGGAVGRVVAGAGMAAASAVAGAVAAAAGAVGAALRKLAGAGMGGSSGGGGPSGRGAMSTGASPSGGPNWLQRLAAWAEEKRKAMQQDLDRLRHREIERLLHALKHSPDEGLRFALPLGNCGRQGYPPGAHLPDHGVDFRLPGIAGGGAVDFWDVSPEYQHRLAQSYRELANREIRLGRHRRAAYIFAELLGDLTSAAATLADGGHFREAAVLYEERLKQPLAAARCLERGGLWAEAIAIYERLNEWETVGDLYRKLDQPEAATAAYRRAVDRRLAAHDRLGAAKLLETKLDAAEEALETLVGGWPDSAQAEQCVDESFRLVALLRQHERARDQVAMLRQATHSQTKLAPLAARLAAVATDYPDDGVRHAAVETTRSIVSTGLAEASLAESQSLLRSLGLLVPSDRLLERDCRRYQEHRAAVISRLAQRPSRAGSRLPKRVNSFRLPAGEWRTAVSIGEEFYAVGVYRDHFLLIRANWDGAVQLAAGEVWQTMNGYSADPVLAADPRGVGRLFAYTAPGQPQTVLRFAATNQFPRPLEAGPHHGVGENLIGMCYGDASSTLLARLACDEVIEVATYNDERYLEGKRTVRCMPDSWDEYQFPLPLFSRQSTIYLGIGRQLITHYGIQEATLVHSPIRHITGSASHTRSRVVLTCEQGGIVIWGKGDSSRQSTCAMDLFDPVVGLTRGGWLVAATSEAIQVYGTHDGRLSFVGESEGPGQPPVAVLPTGDADRFALLQADGGVSVYRVL
jgi:tetratricopeptide (TPR) repeat protein